MGRTEQSVKKELEQALAAKIVDYSKVLSLSNELATYDKSHVRFSVDAGIINRLGKELVGKGETAISELIKNAYDAEASYVNLVFANAYQPGGRLTIEDDGLGMSYEQIVNGFMRISSSDKVHNPISPNYKRKKAGKKGIGRFATQRLGSRLTIISQTKDSDFALKTTIYWDNFSIDTNLSDISSEISEIKKEREQGTTLIIDNLFEGWSDAAVTRAYRYTEDLIIPEPLSDERIKWDNARQDPGFKASFYRESLSDSTKVIDENIAFYNHALAIIDGYIDAHGQGYWRINSSKLSINNSAYNKIGYIREDANSLYPHVHSIHFKTYYFIYEKSLIPGPLFSYVKKLGNEIGGLLLYRNGFRVPPYGDKGNDWLGFDESVRRRVFLFPHQNQSYFGYVEIDEQASELFEETASREGVIENESFHELTDFVYRSITSACTVVAAVRKRKQTAGQKDWDKKKQSPIENYNDALHNLSSLIDKSEQENDDKQKQEEYQRVYDQFVDTKSDFERLQDEINMLRVLAGLGLAIGEFIHEIKYYFPGFYAEIDYLKKVLSGNAEALERITTLHSNIDAMNSFSAFFDLAISNNARRTLEPIEIKKQIAAFEKVISNDSRIANIIIEDNRHDKSTMLSDLITAPMHPAEWASIFFNLYSNAKKAINKASVEQGKIYIKCGENIDKIYIEFSDNGCGVDPEIKDYIFDAFITTSSAAANNTSDAEAYTGSGLGLSIIHDIVNSYNGSISLLEVAENGYITTFRIEIPKYLQNEI